MSKNITELLKGVSPVEIMSALDKLIDETYKTDPTNDYLYENDENNFDNDIEAGFTSLKTNKNGDVMGHKRHPLRLYEYLYSMGDIHYCEDTKYWRQWDGKKFNIITEGRLKQFLQKHYKNPECEIQNERSAFVDILRSQNVKYANDFTLKDDGLVNLRNGIYSMKSKKLLPHEPKNRMSYLININYVEETEAPIWNDLLELITCGRPHMMTAIEEFIGYIFSGCSYKRFNKYLILDGEGSNGKSTLIRIIKDLIGNENYSATGLMDITTNRFAGHNLVDKLANFCSEEPREAFANSGPLKKITGGDPSMVEAKGQGAFPYEHLAKLIISYNETPYFPDSTKGFKRRILLIPCDQDLDARPQLMIHNVEERVKKEKSAIFYRCINAFHKVVERGRFTYVKEGSTRVNDIIKESNPFLGFVDEAIEITGEADDFLSTKLLFDEYNKLQGLNSKAGFNGFSQKMSKIFAQYEGIKCVRNEHRGYSGIKLR